MSAPEEDWEIQCHDYFNFSMQGTSSCNTGQPHLTGTPPPFLPTTPGHIS